jgi:electron transport complex protein RnfC
MEQVGFKDRECEIILGGPMMGTAVASLELPVTKGVTGILAIAKDHPLAFRNGRVFPCIKCGSCVEACPMHLNPSELGLLARKHEYAVMAERHHLMDCFECGCCAFVCPSSIPLVQYFRVAKAITRERKVPS